MAKQHRHDYLIEKCTELGAAAIWPIIAERSVTRPRDFAVQKWSRRAIEAAKQAHRAWVPTIAAAQPLDAALARASEFDAAFLADPALDGTPLDQALATLPAAGSMLVLVGPEGGWSPPELEQARHSGIRTVSLSPTVLRTETAAVAVCAAVALRAARVPAS
jgi:16S rRNA (uracil1498-N3)-methyltransferase